MPLSLSRGAWWQVVNGLQAVQWQLLGYESKADGQPDHERPLYSMSNPNPVVNSIVRRYATDTMANLHVRRSEASLVSRRMSFTWLSDH